MNQRIVFSVVLVLSVAAAVLASLFPITRYLSKTNPDLLAFSTTLFWEMSLPRLLPGLALAVLALGVFPTRPKLGVALAVASPLLAFAIDLAAMAIS